MTYNADNLAKGARPQESHGAAPRRTVEGARPQSAGGKAVSAPTAPVKAPSGGSGISK
jgi:hypothetical protein